MNVRQEVLLGIASSMSQASSTKIWSNCLNMLSRQWRSRCIVYGATPTFSSNDDPGNSDSSLNLVGIELLRPAKTRSAKSASLLVPEVACSSDWPSGSAIEVADVAEVVSETLPI